MKQLPPELWMQIAEAVIDEDAIAFSAQHVITRTLFALLTLNRAISKVARRLLLDHCLYIDRAWRLHALNQCLEGCSGKRGTNIEKLFLAPFPLNEVTFESRINNESVVNGIHTLLDKIGSGLRKVVVDIDFRSYLPEDDVDTGLRPILRKAFAKLEKVEEFISVNDELYLDDFVSDVWQELLWFRWFNLRFLGLYNLDISRPDAIEAITTNLPLLKVLVLARADGLDEGIQDLFLGMRAPLDVRIVNTPFGHDMGSDEHREEFRKCLEPSQETLEIRGQSCRMVRFHRVDVDADVPAASTWDYDPIASCQSFLLEEGIRRTVWQL
ncbi:hypothetical protein MBLNU457_3720t1 [Dothideomycetes sp. NU457]